MKPGASRILQIFTLIVAGEIIFGLPFATARFFRPTLLEAFHFSNTELGDIFAVYGVTAMLSYFPGGVLADYFSARRLLAVSLLTTAAGGLYMATYPGVMGMALLYGYWGVTSILLFWGALIRATREWGGRTSQGKAFGILDGGRGLVSASVAMLALMAFASFAPNDASLITDMQRESGFRIVILIYVTITLLAAALVWIVIPDTDLPAEQRRNPFTGVVTVIRRPLVWAQAAVIVCAYCGYKGLDNYSLYAVQVLGMDEVQGAGVATYGAYIRPVGAVMAGLLADRYTAARVIGLMFALMMVSYLVLFLFLPSEVGLSVIYGNLVVSFFAVYGLRGVYFALLEETRTPKFLTGTTVGFVSFVGYTPDVFFGPITGRILDAAPGPVGHQNYFLFLACVSVVGVTIVAILLWLQQRAISDELKE